MRSLIALSLLTVGLAVPQPSSAQSLNEGALCPDTWSTLNGYTAVALGCYCSFEQATGNIWGSNPYTSYSSICGAALHSAAIPESGGIVWSIITEGLKDYGGTFANGIETRDYGAYRYSATIQYGPTRRGRRLCL